MKNYVKDVGMQKGIKYKGRVIKTEDMSTEKNGETVISAEISIDNADQFIKPDFNVDVKISK